MIEHTVGTSAQLPQLFREVWSNRAGQYRQRLQKCGVLCLGFEELIDADHQSADHGIEGMAIQVVTDFFDGLVHDAVLVVGGG